MTKKYETLDEYLDDLDMIKEELAKAIEGMSPKEVEAYFAKGAQATRSQIRKEP